MHLEQYLLQLKRQKFPRVTIIIPNLTRLEIPFLAIIKNGLTILQSQTRKGRQEEKDELILKINRIKRINWI